MIRAALVGAVLAVASADVPAEPVDLGSIPAHASELDGHWVEFDAYASQVGDAPLMVTSGAMRRSADGKLVMACHGEGAIRLPVFQRRRTSIVSRKELANLERWPKVRVRALFYNAPVTTADPVCVGLCDEDHPMYFDRGIVVKRYEKRADCLR